MPISDGGNFTVKTFALTKDLGPIRGRGVRAGGARPGSVNANRTCFLCHGVHSTIFTLESIEGFNFDLFIDKYRKRLCLRTTLST